MNRMYLLGGFMLLLVTVVACQRSPVMSIEAGRMGDVAYLAPESEPTGLDG